MPKKYFLLIILTIILVFVCNCSDGNSGYTTWTLESTRFPYQAPEDYPRYTFEYPSSFMESPPSDALAPVTVWLIRKQFGADSWDDLEENKNPPSQAELEDFIEWEHAQFQLYINPDSSWDPFAMAPLEEHPGSLSENESTQVLEVSRIVIDGITAERTTKRYYTKQRLYGAEAWRIYIRTEFEYCRFNCGITMDAPWGKRDIMTEYYNHILETFQIMDRVS